MSLYEPLFRNILYPAYESGIWRRRTLDYLREYEASQWQSPEAIAALQWSKLKRLIDHCWDDVPYYRERWQQAGIAAPADIRTPADYARLPVLTKADIRENFEQLKATSYRDRLLYKTTSGSTAEPLRFGCTRESQERRMATMFRGYGWTGARVGQRTLYLWGASLNEPMWPRLKHRIYHAAFNRRVLNTFLMTDARMAEYADTVEAFKPDVIVSYVTPIVRLSEWMLAHGRRFSAPERILGAAEGLSETQRSVIQKAFGCPVYNTYGCREVMLIAAECEHRNGLHINADHLKVELGTPLNPSSPNGPAELLLTDLHNYGMPLLRYANGDLGSGISGRCPCGRGLPRLASVDGRKLDALRTIGGHTLLADYIEYIFLGVSGIRRYQVVQRRIDALDITIVRDVDFNEAALDVLRRELAKVVGSSIQCNFVYADEIPLTAAGKFRVTISELE